MSNDTAIVTSGKSAIAAYGNREEVREITDRLMAMHPEATTVGKDVMRTVAQLAIMRGANPLPTAGEIWVWQDWGGKVNMTMGIAYYRRIASSKDTVLWLDEPRLMTDLERAERNIPQGDLGAICRGALLSGVRELVSVGASFQEAKELLARTATAVVEYGDQYYTNDNPKRGIKSGDLRAAPHGRTWEWVAEKRAERDFYVMMSLVDDSLTNKIDAANYVTSTVDAAYQLHAERQSYTVDDANHDFFGVKKPALDEPEPEVIDGDFDDIPFEDEPEPPIDWRSKIASIRNPTVRTIASILVAAGIKPNEPHAIGSIIKHYPDLDGPDHQLKTDEALTIWDNYQEAEPA